MQGGDHNDVVNPNGGEKQAEIYTHDAPWLIYACNWSVRCCVLFYALSFSFAVVLGGVFFAFLQRASRIGCDPRERMDMCHHKDSRSFFCLFVVPRKKTTDTTPLSLSRSLGVVIIIIIAFFSRVR